MSSVPREADEPVAAVIARDLEQHLHASGMPDLVVSGAVPFGDGHSGFTYALDLTHGVNVRRCVLRLSPPGARIRGPADVGRQGRIMAALSAAGTPVPAVIAWASTAVVDGRAFVLMEHVEGHGWADAVATAGPRAVARGTVEALLRIQTVPVAGTGLRGDPVIAPGDEVARWSALLERTPSRLRLAGGHLSRRLAASAPAPSRTVLSHGDFHYGNLIFDNAVVVAVVDWEIAALGEPLLDLGCLVVATLRRKYDPEPNPTGGVEIAVMELLDMYGATREAATWFVAASCLKYAAILGYNAQLHRSGRRPDLIYDQLEQTMHGLVDDGELILRDGLDIAAWSVPHHTAETERP